MDYSLAIFLILNFGPPFLRASHYPDLTCFPSYEKAGMDPHEEICLKRTRNPLNRDCYKACMLEQLLIINPPDIYDPNSTEYSVMTLEDPDYLAELKLVLFNEKEVNTVATNIITNCAETIHLVINHNKHNCEEWEPIYECVQGALCSTEKFYPDMSCHNDYRSYPFRRERNFCLRKIGLPTTQDCLKGCILQQLGIYVYDTDEPNPYPQMGSMDGEYYYYNMLFNFIDGLSGNRMLAEALVRNVNTLCNETFISVVNDRRLHCSKWDELFECVERYLQCNETVIGITMPPPLKSAKASTTRSPPATDLQVISTADQKPTAVADPASPGPDDELLPPPTTTSADDSAGAARRRRWAWFF